MVIDRIKNKHEISFFLLNKKIIDNPLKNAPHTIKNVMSDSWDHKYSRATAAFPAKWLNEYKYWPCVGRVDNAYGDRNLVCTCPPLSDYK